VVQDSTTGVIEGKSYIVNENLFPSIGADASPTALDVNSLPSNIPCDFFLEDDDLDKYFGENRKCKYGFD